jgi:ABC-type branched-subunit amino acid transport system ATPase component
MGPRGANRNYTYSKITHINSQEGKSWLLIEHDIQTCYKYIKYIIYMNIENPFENCAHSLIDFL